MGAMSTCAFCGDRHRRGMNFLAHRISSARVRTVKVCSTCIDDARDAGYYVTQREPLLLDEHAQRLAV
jgi:hypothetical protein